MIKIELLKKIPNDIIINNIIPYTYMRKCPKHLQDIRSFYNHFKLLENYYCIYSNEYILFNDLERFFCKSDRLYFTTNQYYNIFQGHIHLIFFYIIRVGQLRFLVFHLNILDLLYLSFLQLFLYSPLLFFW